MATKGGRDKIKLESTAGTGHFYTTTKNKKTMPEKTVSYTHLTLPTKRIV